VEKRWLFPEAVPSQVEADLGSYGAIKRQLLFSRGLTESRAAGEFLEGRGANPHDPGSMAGMAAAVERIQEAESRGEQVVVYGDYDADGVTATALLVTVLRQLGIHADGFIPNRFDEGYGLHAEALRTLRADGAALVVTVDCGIRSVAEAALARQLGMDLIVTDHHQPGARLPEACAILCPRREGDGYPFKGLAGVGIAYKLAEALCLEAGTALPEDALQLFAVGTVADLAPLVDENRTLVALGLQSLNQFDGATPGQRPGLGCLIRAAGTSPGRVDAGSVAFGLAPRLNAAGRLETADIAFRLLLSEDRSEADALAGMLNDANRKRQALMRAAVGRARELVSAHGESDLYFVVDPQTSEGVVGLVASRLVEELHRPVIVGTEKDEHIRASARSIPEFHVTAALDMCSDLLVQYGGHAMAAGFTIRRANAEAVAGRLREQARTALAGKHLQPALQLDAVVGIDDVGSELLRFVERFEPCGYANPRPMLALRDVAVLEARRVGSEGSHLRLRLGEGRRQREAIAFRLGHLAEQLPGRVDVAFHSERNTYQGVETLQLNVQAIRAAEAQ
jgi:single-stranded-DNA-specific exonuclease